MTTKREEDRPMEIQPKREDDLRVDPKKTAEQSVERQKLDQLGVDEEKARLLTEKPFDYIERTKPDDPSGRPGQLTRDNVNPAIPSGERGAPPNAGGIVDPTSLGMEQGGKAPVGLMQPENPIGARFEDARYDRLNEVGERKGEIEQRYHDDLAKLNREENERTNEDLKQKERK